MKKLTVGSVFAAVTAILALASLIVYNWNVGAPGYYQHAKVSNLALFCILAIVGMVLAIVLANLRLQGPGDTVASLIVGAIQIVVPALLALCLINLIAARAEGLGFIYFSNADVIVEVQTPENLSSATGAITNMVCLGVSTVVGIVTAFLNIKKKAA